MSDLHDLQSAALKFRDDRDWKQYHNPKDEAVSLVLEATELLEHFQWKATEEAMQKHIAENREEVADELCDVLYWVLVMAHDLSYDLPKEFMRKIEKSEKKYPVEKVKGTARKWTEI
jgi:NTP pyrophosphatase (non-canonical NTP hydrolase)